MNTHHANSAVIYGESRQSGGTNDLHTQLSEEDINRQGFPYRIRLHPEVQAGLCVFVSVQVCVCCWH